ncbi:hypothetical protein MRB53_021429 [Persea americana]|uniref:Uncharacterized protein n=1 Tax=Persea americana TaxID=3435 RepID=A0ACC2L3P1_PERAE|nr:hypothetical protein MRB53_021429 [Persea americana]
MIGSLNIICNWYFSLVVLALTISFTKFSLATNTLEIGQSITDGQTLVSAGENFVLGFFSPGNSTNRYVGVWYYKVPEQTVIWVANGRNPIPNKNSGVLTITRDGSFMILDSSGGSSYLLANGSSLKNPSAKILDTGNLVFGETNPDGNEEKILWQSFDYPTDSLLPSMKLVLNKSTGENHVLTSWRSAEDPAPGEYAFGVDTNDNFNIWKNGISQWKSRGRSWLAFTVAPDSSSSYILNFSSPSDEKLGSFSYTTNNNSVITRLVISMTGQMNRFSWSVSRQMWIVYWEQPKRGCNVSSLCGAYGICSESAFPTCQCLEGFEPASVRDWTAGVWSVGCKRNIKLRCGVNGSVDEGDDVFVKLSKVGFGKAQPQPLRIGSQEECKVACMRNCSCFAYAYEKGCYVWEGDLFNLQQLQDDDETGRDIYLRVARERKEAPTSSDPSSLQKGTIRWSEPNPSSLGIYELGGIREALSRLGCNRMLVSFPDSVAANSAIGEQDSVWNKAFVSLEKWVPTLAVNLWEIWIQFFGVPLRGWGEEKKTVENSFGINSVVTSSNKCDGICGGEERWGSNDSEVLEKSSRRHSIQFKDSKRTLYPSSKALGEETSNRPAAEEEIVVATGSGASPFANGGALVEEAELTNSTSGSKDIPLVAVEETNQVVEVGKLVGLSNGGPGIFV